MNVELHKIKDRVPSLASPVLFTDLPENVELCILKQGRVRAGEPLMELRTKDDEKPGTVCAGREP